MSSLHKSLDDASYRGAGKRTVYVIDVLLREISSEALFKAAQDTVSAWFAKSYVTRSHVSYMDHNTQRISAEDEALRMFFAVVMYKLARDLHAYKQTEESKKSLEQAKLVASYVGDDKLISFMAFKEGDCCESADVDPVMFGVTRGLEACSKVLNRFSDVRFIDAWSSSPTLDGVDELMNSVFDAFRLMRLPSRDITDDVYALFTELCVMMSGKPSVMLADVLEEMQEKASAA